MNVPGLTHDSTVADWGNIYSKLEEVYNETGAKCCVDLAFQMANRPYLIKSLQDYTAGKGATNAEVLASIAIKCQAASMQQSAEWGMRALQSSFPQLTDRMSYKSKGERRIAMKMMILIYNLRANLVGINQIKKFYLPNLNIDACQYLN